MSRAFAVQLGRYESPRGTYRSHDGFIHLPEEIADVVVVVFRLEWGPGLVLVSWEQCHGAGAQRLHPDRPSGDT